MILGTLREKWSAWHEPLWFVAVGIANTLAYFAVAIALFKFAGLPAYLASGIGYVVAIMVNFLGNSIFTFAHGRWNSLRQLLSHLGLYGIGLVYNMGVVHLFDVATGFPVFGFVVLAVTWPVIAYFLSKHFVFTR